MVDERNSLVWCELPPPGIVSKTAILRIPPQPIDVSSLAPEALPDAWSGGKAMRSDECPSRADHHRTPGRSKARSVRPRMAAKEWSVPAAACVDLDAVGDAPIRKSLGERHDCRVESPQPRRAERRRIPRHQHDRAFGSLQRRPCRDRQPAGAVELEGKATVPLRVGHLKKVDLTVSAAPDASLFSMDRNMTERVVAPRAPGGVP
jgi:hypothetical protein